MLSTPTPPLVATEPLSVSVEFQAEQSDRLPLADQLTADVVPTWDELAERWNRMQVYGIATPFQNAHWQSIWYGTFGGTPGIEPLLVAVRDRRSGRDVLLLPLIRRRLGSMSVIEFADLWATDYNAPLIAPATPVTVEYAHAVWEQVQNALPKADLIRLTKMPLEAGSRSNPLAMLGGARPSKYTGYAIDLPERWDDYIGSLKKDVRNLLKRRWRRFTEDEKAGLRWIEDPDEGLRTLRTLQAQQTARLASRGVRHIFDDPTCIAFYERLVVKGLRNGSTKMTALVAENEIVATFLAVANAKHCTLIRTSQTTDKRWASLGLGKLIIERSMHALHERGIRRFDLSIGEYQYKHDFQVAPVPLFDLEVAQTWRGSAAIAKDRAWSALKKYPRVAGLVSSVTRTLSPKAASL
jgi:CelD/BcsL family acetyltransferase involved in cellulose biosynthesis